MHDERKSQTMKNRIRRALVTGLVTIAVAPMLAACGDSDDDGGGGGDGDLTQVKLQLQWLPQAQFAGYYAAAE
jgi:NitT/TauT family transport system substrate-binding protein